MALKFIAQTEASECGLACLAMICSAHRVHIGLPALRRRFALSLKGIKLSSLIQLAQQLGFNARPLRLEMEDLPRLALPCIVHWDLNHFVVLSRVRLRQITIADPATGIRNVTREEFSRHFTGVALELVPGSSLEPVAESRPATLQQLTGRMRGLVPSLLQILALSGALQLFVILAPFYTQWVVDQVLVSADRDLLSVLGTGFTLAMLLQVAIGVIRGWSVIHLSNRLGRQWMSNVFAHLLKLPLDYFEKRHLGDITSRMSSVQAIQKTLTTSFIEAMVDGVMAVATLALMLVYSWKLALITMLAVLLYAAIRTSAYRMLRHRTERQLVAAASQQTYLLESIRGMQSIKVAGVEGARRACYDNLLAETVNQDVRLARMSLAFTSASQAVFGLERVLVIWLGARLALGNVFSVGMLVAYLAYKDQFATRVGGLVDKWIEFRMLRLHGERVADIVLTPPQEEAGVLDLSEPVEASVEVTGLGFRYADGEPWVVKDCSFKVAAGESIAIVGLSGCGKTTLMKLLLGLLAPAEGTIKIGGQDLQKLGPALARSMMGAVMQDDQLFAGSIADNIAFFDPDLDMARVEAAARLAAIHADIMAMPMGYFGLIGDMGNAMSGGQKQRMILARALYRQPRLLLLDEATSHLDTMRERLVNESVRNLQLTKIIVAHRPETIASADRVLLMEAGRITGEYCPRTVADSERPADAQVA